MIKLWRKVLIIGLLGLLSLVLTVKLGGCTATTNASGSGALPAISPLPNPSLPDWIEQISPLGESATQAQIRVRFKEPLIPIEQLDSPNQQALLKKFEVMPPLPGEFRFLTPRMVGFQAEKAIPKATRVRVSLKAGLADLKQHRLTQDLTWTFNTEPIKLSGLPTSFPEENGTRGEVDPIDLKPSFTLQANTELDLASLRDHARLVTTDGRQTVRLKATLQKTSASEQEPRSAAAVFDPAARPWVYQLEPRGTLDKGTRYRFEIAPGLRPDRGNLASETPFTSLVETYGPLAFQKLSAFGQPDAGSAFGRFSNGSAQLQFNNGIDAESARAQIQVSPAPQKDIPLVQAYDGEKLVNLNPWALAPATNYTITVGAGLKDRFGQTLGRPVTVPFRTGDVSPDLWAPSDLHIFPTATRQQLQLNLSTVNLSSYKAAFTPVQPTDLVYTDSAYPRETGTNLLPAVSNWKSQTIALKHNETVNVPIPVQSLLGGKTGMLAYGVQARTNAYQEDNQQKWREPSFYGLVQMTNLGVMAQWFPEAGLVRVHHLSDGSAVENAIVQVYQSQLEAKARSTPTVCAIGKTDRTGMLSFNRAALQTCIGAGSTFTTGPKLLVIAQEGSDWAFTRTDEYSGAYAYGIDAGWQNSKPETRGTIFSDRQLYQPGETGWFTGVAYYLQNGRLQQDANAAYEVTLEGPEGRKTKLGSQTTTEYGTFSLQLPLEKNQPLGYYTLRAKAKNGHELTGEFRVAEFKPPNFKVELSLTTPGSQTGLLPDKATALPIALPNQTVSTTTESRYLFGAPVEGGRVAYYVTRQRQEFAPKGWDGFAFGRRWFWPEEPPEVTSDVAQTSQVLNADGQSTQTIPVGNDLPYPMTYRVDAEVTDVSNLSVADSQQFLALPGDRLIGLKSEFVGEAGKPLAVQVIVTDPAGQPLQNQRVRLELQVIHYSRMTRLVEGSRTQQNQVEYQTVATTQVRSSAQPQTVSLTPPKSGSYRIRAKLAGDDQEALATDLQVWVSGDTATYWGDRFRNNRLEVKLDRASYQPGETATVLIQSPYPEAELYVAVVRYNTLYQAVAKVKGSAPKVQFQVTPDMLPNAAVQAILVRQGEPLSQVEPGSLDDLVRIGFAPFQTNLDDRYLKLDLKPGGSTVEPGNTQTVQLALTNADGQPTQGQVTLMVVNEAILQLTGYRPPDLVKTVYAEQPVSVRLSDNRPDVVLQPLASPLQKGWGYGGGLSSGAGNTRTRSDFKPIAYYQTLQTDAQGKAQVSFKLPDDLTTWRIMAEAIAQPAGKPTLPGWRFGQGDATFITSKPLVTNPVLPMFARPGDRFQLGVSATNNTGTAGQLVINGSVTPPLQLQQSTAELKVQADTGTHAYRFPVVVGQGGTAEVQFRSELNGNQDAFKVPLQVRPLEVTEQVVETGRTNTQVTIPIQVSSQASNEVGGLEVNLASSLMPQLTAPVKQVLDETHLPFLEPAASQLTIAATLQTLGQTYGQTFAGFAPAQQAQQAMDRLRPLQKPDGGFAAYPGQEKSDPFLTPYAAQAMAQADRVFGQQISQGMQPALTSYLNQLLANPARYDFCKEQACQNQVRLEALIALAELGDRRGDFLSEIYAGRAQLDPVQQIKLARYLLQFPDWQQEAKTLAGELQEVVNQTGRSATVNLPQNWYWLNSDTAIQAQALQLFITQSGNSDLVNRLAQGLLAQRREGTWSTTYDNAVALTALVDYSKLQPTPPNFQATAQLAGKTISTAQFQGYQQPSQTLTVPMAQLPRGQTNLVLKQSGPGLLHYLAAYRYRLQGNQAGRFAGLRVTRSIRPANQESVIRTIGLYAPDPLKLPAGQVYDIGLELITDHAVNHLVITDPLPAGFEAVDNSLQTSTPYFQAQGDSWQLGFKALYRDRVVAYGNRLEPGVYTMHYLVRSVTPGTFLYPGAEAHLQYAPEEFGRSAASTLEIAQD